MGRALKDLNIRLINANSPRPKGAWNASSAPLSTDAKLSKNLTFRYDNRLFFVITKGWERRMQHAEITVCKAPDDTLTLLHQGSPLEYRIPEQGQTPPVADDKTLRQTVEQAKTQQADNPRYKPAPDHPRRRVNFGSARDRV